MVSRMSCCAITPYGRAQQLVQMPDIFAIFTISQQTGASSKPGADLLGGVPLQAPPGSSRGVPRSLGVAGARAGSCAAAAGQPAHLLHPQSLLRLAVSGPRSLPHQVPLSCLFLPAALGLQLWEHFCVSGVSYGWRSTASCILLTVLASLHAFCIFRCGSLLHLAASSPLSAGPYSLTHQAAATSSKPMCSSSSNAQQRCGVRSAEAVLAAPSVSGPTRTSTPNPNP